MPSFSVIGSSVRDPGVIHVELAEPYGSVTHLDNAKGTAMSARPMAQTFEPTAMPGISKTESLNSPVSAFNLTAVLEGFCNQPVCTNLCQTAHYAWEWIKDVGSQVINQTESLSNNVCTGSMKGTCESVQNATQTAFENLHKFGNYTQNGFQTFNSTAYWVSDRASSLWNWSSVIPGGQLLLASMAIIFGCIVFVTLRRDKVLVYNNVSQMPIPQINPSSMPAADPNTKPSGQETKKEPLKISDSILDELTFGDLSNLHRRV